MTKVCNLQQKCFTACSCSDFQISRIVWRHIIILTHLCIMHLCFSMEVMISLKGKSACVLGLLVHQRMRSNLLWTWFTILWWSYLQYLHGRPSNLVFSVCYSWHLIFLAAACQSCCTSVVFLLMIHQALHNIMDYALLEGCLSILCDYLVDLASHVDIG